MSRRTHRSTHRPAGRRPLLRAVPLAAVIATLLAVSACSSAKGSGGASSPATTASGASGAASTSSSPPPAPATLTIAQPSKSLDFLPLYIGIEQGYFKAQNLTVNLVATGGPATVNYVISGQSDLAAYSLGTTVISDDAGKTLPIIYNMETNLPTALAVKKGITTIDQLKAVSNCKLVAGTPGTQSYYAGNYYIQRLGLTNCSLVSSSADTATIAGIIGGSYTAAALSISGAIAATTAGLTLLVDPGKPSDAQTYLPTQYYPVVNLFGLAAHLADRKDVILRLITALKNTQKYIDSTPVATIATDVLDSKELPGETQASLEAELADELPYLTTKLATPQGSISQADWTYALSQLNGWGLAKYTENAPTHQYAQAVDMSYYNAAPGPS